MAVTRANLRGIVTRHRRESIRVGIALGVAVVSVIVGAAARNRIAPVAIQRNRLRSTQHDIVAFRAAFRHASLEERAFRLPDSLSVAVARDARFSVAQRLAQRAEQLGLTSVRVRFAAADSGEAPAIPEVSDTRVAVADYSIALDCRGDFASLLALVNQLPASVSLQRLGAERAPVGGAVDYHLALAVFESSKDSTTAPVAGDALQQVAQLLPYATPPGDSELAITPAGGVSVLRDPFVGRSIARIAAVAPVGAVAAGAGVATAPTVETAKVPAPVYRVTTTLMAGARRAALINDQLIYVGESLPDGSKLTSVERDRVIVTDHSGTAHIVAVAREGES